MANPTQGGGRQSPPPPPPAPDPAGPPSLVAAQKAAAAQSKTTANTGTPGSGGAPPGNNTTTPPSGGTGGTQPKNRRKTGMKAGNALVLAALVLGLLIGGAMLLSRGCGGHSPFALGNTPASSGSVLTPVPTPPAPPTMGPVMMPADANLLSQCGSTLVGKSSDRWYLVSTTVDSGITLATRLCVGAGGKFKAADTARVVGNTVYLREGGHDVSGTIDTTRKLSDIASAKVYVDVEKPGGSTATVRMSNPYLAFIGEEPAFDFCSQYANTTAESVKEDLVKQEIVARCKLVQTYNNNSPAASHHKAVAQTLEAWASRKDVADLAAAVKAGKADADALRAQIAAIDAKVVDQPLPPQSVGYTIPPK